MVQSAKFHIGFMDDILHGETTFVILASHCSSSVLHILSADVKLLLQLFQMF